LSKRRFCVPLSLAAGVFLIFNLNNCVSFGRTPRGERLERLRNSPHYRDGGFHNLSPAEPEPADAPRRSRIGGLLKFIFSDKKGVVPERDIPTSKTVLTRLGRSENVFVWLGHSSCFIQVDGVRFLIDPVFVKAAPVSFVNRPFRGSDIYKPEDMPDVDYIIITHDHWDHLDYGTVTRLKDRYRKIICGLGVGEHFEYWGFDRESVIELDWDESVLLEGGVTVNCFTARHFSGRGLFSRNKTLWASYMLQTPSRNIFISGDGGYDTHFAALGRKFPRIDLAVMENGQYNLAWRNSHLLPEDLVRAVKELRPAKLITVHNSKYSLSTHRWDEPLSLISRADEEESLNLLTPMIGELVLLDDPNQRFTKWWVAPDAP
jgi:L-ascorbate metabolism protein UlaG (beta-lactamase superfamily)